jgi:hypothetical protein
MCIQIKTKTEKLSLLPSILAILSRFNGNREQAYMYCASLAFAYPRLAEEYLGYMEAL